MPISVREERWGNQNLTSREAGNIGYTRRRLEKQTHNTICVGHHYRQTITYSFVSEPWISHLEDQNWVAPTSIKFKSQLNLKCKFFLCTGQVNLSVNEVLTNTLI
jgi:hypothetical protein